MGMVSELMVSIGVEGTGAVIAALKEVDGAQVELKNSAKDAEGATKSQLQSTGSGWTDLLSGVNLSVAAIVGVTATAAVEIGKFAIDSAAKWADYNLAMEKGSIATGLVVDEYSRLIQAADDAFVSQDKMAKAMEMATKNGYPMTIDSLGQIADKLNAIKDPAEKAKLATDIFGRGWADIMPFLDQGSAGIDKATKAIDDNLVATEKSVQESKDYTHAVDDLTDAWTGFKNEVGAAVLPVLSGVLSSIADQISQVKLLKNNMDLLRRGWDDGTISLDDLSNANLAANFSTEAGIYATNNLVKVVDSATVANEALLKATNASANAHTEWTDVQSGLNKMVKAGTVAQEEYSDALWAGDNGAALKALYDAHLDEYNAQIKSNEALYAAQDAWDANTIAAADMASQIDAAAAAQARLHMEAVKTALGFQQQMIGVTSLTTNFGNIIGYAKNYDSVVDQIAAKSKERDDLLARGWWKTSEKVKALDGDIAGLQGTLTDMGNQLILDMFQATIAIGGITEAELGAYLDMAVEMGFISEQGANAAIGAYNGAIKKINGLTIDEKTGNVVVDAAAAYAAFDAIEQYAFAEKVVKVQMKLGANPSPGPWDQDLPTKAIGGPVYPGHGYIWNEPGREGEMLIPSQYGRVMSSTEVAMAMREALRPGDGVSAGKQAQVVNNNHTEVVINATVASDYDLDKLTREIVRKINA